LSKRFWRLKKFLGFGPEHTFHSMRHTMVILLHQAGVPLKQQEVPPWE